MKTTTTSQLRKRSLLVAAVLFFNVAVTHAATITVTSAGDSGAGTLRQAIVDANSGDTINFSLPSGTAAIILTSDRLVISKNLTITGPGAKLLSVVRGRAQGQPFFHFRIFDIEVGQVTISGLTIVNGNPLSNNVGGGIYNIGILTIVNCVVSGNSTSGTSDKGGGIYNGGTVTIANSTISGNSSDAASGDGGGIYNNQGTITITNSTISGNSAEAGDGIFNTGGMMTITNSTISGNSASSGGVAGGIYNFTGGTMTITNSTVSGNSTTDIGGIFNNGGTMTISNSTISGNSATTVNVGGIENSSGTVNVKDTIIAGNTSQDFKGALTSQGYNLIGNNSGTTITGTTTGNQLNVDPKLGPLQNNGGPTFTQA
jgi:Right handed beta helix region